MKKLLVSLLLLGAVTTFASECDKLPAAGTVELEVMLNDSEDKGLFLASLEIDNNVEQYGGQIVNRHTFQSPRMLVNGKEVPLSKIALSEIAKSLGYEYIEYTTLMEYRGRYIDRDLNVQKTPIIFGDPVIVVDPDYFAVFYHSKCSNWTY